MTPEAIQYIKDQLNSGTTRESVKNSLIQSGWPEAEVETSLVQVEKEMFGASQFDAAVPQGTVGASAPKSKTKIVLISILTLILVLLVGTGVFGYFYLKPESLLQRFVTKATKVKSFSYEGKFSAEVKDFGGIQKLTQSATNQLAKNIVDSPNIAGVNTEKAQSDSLSGSQNIQSSITYAGDIDTNDINNPSVRIRVSTNVNAEVLGGAQTLTFESRLINKVVYFRMEKWPDIKTEDLAFINQYMKTLEGQWISMDVSSEMPAPGQKVSDEDLKIVTSALKANNPFKLVNTIPIAWYNNQPVYYYKFTIDKTKIVDFVNSLEKDESFKMDATEIADVEKEIENVSMPTGEMWFGLFDSMLYKINFAWSYNDTQMLQLSIDMNSETSFKNYNAKITVEVPTGAKTIEEIEQTITQSFATDTDKDGLSDQLETVYGTNPNKADTDGDGFSDGDEIKNGYNPNGPGKLEIKATPALST